LFGGNAHVFILLSVVIVTVPGYRAGDLHRSANYKQSQPLKWLLTESSNVRDRVCHKNSMLLTALLRVKHPVLQRDVTRRRKKQ